MQITDKVIELFAMDVSHIYQIQNDLYDQKAKLPNNFQKIVPGAEALKKLL